MDNFNELNIYSLKLKQMKKLSLKTMHLGGTEVLTREQMKKIGGGDSTCYTNCTLSYLSDCRDAGGSTSWCWGNAKSYCNSHCTQL